MNNNSKQKYGSNVTKTSIILTTVFALAVFLVFAFLLKIWPFDGSVFMSNDSGILGIVNIDDYSSLKKTVDNGVNAYLTFDSEKYENYMYQGLRTTWLADMKINSDEKKWSYDLDFELEDDEFSDALKSFFEYKKSIDEKREIISLKFEECYYVGSDTDEFPEYVEFYSSIINQIEDVNAFASVTYNLKYKTSDGEVLNQSVTTDCILVDGDWFIILW